MLKDIDGPRLPIVARPIMTVKNRPQPLLWVAGMAKMQAATRPMKKVADN